MFQLIASDPKYLLMIKREFGDTSSYSNLPSVGQRSETGDLRQAMLPNTDDGSEEDDVTTEVRHTYRVVGRGFDEGDIYFLKPRIKTLANITCGYVITNSPCRRSEKLIQPLYS